MLLTISFSKHMPLRQEVLHQKWCAGYEVAASRWLHDLMETALYGKMQNITQAL